MICLSVLKRFLGCPLINIPVEHNRIFKRAHNNYVNKIFSVERKTDIWYFMELQRITYCDCCSHRGGITICAKDFIDYIILGGMFSVIGSHY